MKQSEAVYREILYQAIEKRNTHHTQSAISTKLELSLSVVNLAVRKLEALGGVKVAPRGLQIRDIKKILYFWGSARNLEKDVCLKTRVEASVREIERMMPNVIFTGYTGYKLKFSEIPSDYSEVYCYADETELQLIRKRLSSKRTSGDRHNLFILKTDNNMGKYSSITIGQLFVDLWNLKEWYSKEFMKAMEARLEEWNSGTLN